MTFYWTRAKASHGNISNTTETTHTKMKSTVYVQINDMYYFDTYDYYLSNLYALIFRNDCFPFMGQLFFPRFFFHFLPHQMFYDITFALWRNWQIQQIVKLHQKSSEYFGFSTVHPILMKRGTKKKRVLSIIWGIKY